MQNTITYNGKLNAVGSKIKDYRINNNMSQEQLTAKLQVYGINLHKNSLQKIERGDRVIKEYELAVFCDIFKVSADEILKGCVDNLIK